MKRIILSIIVAGIWGLCFCASPAQAEPITIAIEAVVDRVDDRSSYLEGKIKTGDIITGTYIYDSSTVDTNPSPYVGDYEHYTSPCGIFLTVSGFEFHTDLANVAFLLEVVNDYPSGDSYLLLSYNNLPLSNGTLVDHISWQLNDPTESVLSSDALPLIPPVLDQWQSIVGLCLDGQRGGYIVDAHVTSAIPEPVTILLFGLGGLLLRRQLC